MHYLFISLLYKVLYGNIGHPRVVDDDFGRVYLGADPVEEYYRCAAVQDFIVQICIPVTFRSGGNEDAVHEILFKQQKVFPFSFVRFVGGGYQYRIAGFGQGADGTDFHSHLDLRLLHQTKPVK